MPEFMVRMDGIKVCSQKCENISAKLNLIKDKIWDSEKNLEAYIKKNGIDDLLRIVHMVGEDVSKKKQTVDNLKIAFERIAEEYQKAENSILDGGILSQLEIKDTAYKIDSVLFDDDGSYGGNQGRMEMEYLWNPYKCFDVLKTVREYYPDMNIWESYKLLDQFNKNGCSYIAFANAILLRYEGKKEEFERTFGFPMYQKNGEPNYERLALDYYAYVDRTDQYDEENGHPIGMTDGAKMRFTEEYMRQKGEHVTSVAKGIGDITPENFEEISKNCVVTINVRENYLYTKKGDKYIPYQYIDGGHAMVVTGVTDDGKFTVSSWGEKFYVDPSELDKIVGRTENGEFIANGGGQEYRFASVNSPEAGRIDSFVCYEF